MKRNLAIAAVLILIAAAARLVPHVWNVAPVAAAALLAGAILPRKWAVAVPILAMLASDFFLGAYHWPVMLTVYGCFMATALMGSWLKDLKPVKILGTSLISSTLFFLATNFAVWASGDWYEKSWQGLALCYTIAAPFFRNTLLGDLFYAGVLFGAWALVFQAVPLMMNFKIVNAKQRVDNL